MSAQAIPTPGRLEETYATTLFARIFSFPVALAACLVFLVFWSCAPRFDDPDLWWHLKIGETIWVSHHIPNVDLFSFTANGSQWIAHEWLSQLILYGVYQAGGFSALQACFSLLASAIVVLTYVLCGLWSRNWKVSLLGGIGALFFLTVSLAIRPLLLGHLFLLIELLLLYAGVVKRSKWIFALPVLFVIWANCHGSFLFGLVVLFCAGLWHLCLQSERRDVLRWSTLLLLCLLAPLLNPIGPALALYPINVLLFQPDNIGNVEEWAPLNLLEARGIGLAGLLAFVIFMRAGLRKQLAAAEWFALAVTAAMAFRHTRMVPIFGFIACPIACRMLADSWDKYDPRRDHPFLNAALIAAAAMFSFVAMPDAADIAQQIASKEPVAAVAAVAKLPGPLLNEYAWGGFLMWNNPHQPVFIDGRTDIYAWNGVMRDYGRWAMQQEDPQLLLDRYQIRTCILNAASPMAGVLAHLPGWTTVYSDNLAVVVTRSALGTREP